MGEELVDTEQPTETARALTFDSRLDSEEIWKCEQCDHIGRNFVTCTNFQKSMAHIWGFI